MRCSGFLHKFYIILEDVVGEEDVENIDLNAVLGGGIKKAPAAATEPEPELEPEHIEATA